MSDGTTVQAAANIRAAVPSRRTEILDGLKVTLPFMVGATPFGVIFGALATAEGLSPVETMALSLFVFSGSAQFVAISLIALATPAWVIWLVTFILNLRHTLYAATLIGYVRHLSLGWRFILSAGLTDETFAAMEDRYCRLGVHCNSHWAYLASIVAMHLNWNSWTLIGIAVGTQVKGLDGLGLEFAAIATFIGMVVQKLRTPGAQTAAAVAGILAALLAALLQGRPHHRDAGRHRRRGLRRAPSGAQEPGMSVGIVIVGMALINLLLRCPLFLVANRIRIPGIVENALAHCPVAVLTAIIVPFALHLDQAPDGSQWLNPDLFATIAAIAASLLTRNLMVTIAVGLGIALFLRHLAIF